MKKAKWRQTTIPEYLKPESGESDDEKDSSSDPGGNPDEGQRRRRSQIELWSRIIKVSSQDREARYGHDISEDKEEYNNWVEA